MIRDKETEIHIATDGSSFTTRDRLDINVVGRSSLEPSVDSELPQWGTRTVQSRRDTETLAEILLREMGEMVPIPNRGVRAAAYAELDGTASPAVHVECGFLTNRSDAALLVDPEFQATLGNAIARGIGAYRRLLASGEVDSP